MIFFLVLFGPPFALLFLLMALMLISSNMNYDSWADNLIYPVFVAASLYCGVAVLVLAALSVQGFQ
jgi:Ni/Fe-hydrogenase subunit HybB-like protein